MKHLLWSIKWYLHYGLRQWWRWRHHNKYYKLQSKLFPKERYGLLFNKDQVVLYIKGDLRSQDNGRKETT